MFLLTRNKPTLPDDAYWASVETEGGWRTEFAGYATYQKDLTTLKNCLSIRSGSEPLFYEDNTKGQTRYAWFKGTRIEAVLYVGPSPVSVSRSWLCAKFEEDFSDPVERYKLIAGRAPVNEIDKGAIVCSCLSVGANEIAAAVQAGYCNVGAIGKKTKAGTNCGSCRSEIAEIIKKNMLVAAQ
nr:(2Fe-2S)-binding protein [Sneathiella limimaris]